MSKEKEKETSIHEVLCAIQGALKAPKSQRNNFGKYKYRSCEDILEALKPLLQEHGASILANDSIKEFGGRLFLQATQELRVGGDSVAVQAYAEICQHKGMSMDQCTGTASSYARKYALNGLFAIDDTKDADTLEPAKEQPWQPSNAEITYATAARRGLLKKCQDAIGVHEETFHAYLVNAKVIKEGESWFSMPEKAFKSFIANPGEKVANALQWAESNQEVEV